MKRFVLGISAFCCIFSAAYASEEVKLPKVRIAGQEYYVYEIKKGDSLYGISNRYGWDIDRLSRINPNRGEKLEKGLKVYYPVSDETSATTPTTDEFVLPENYPVIQHVVKKGESIYSIAKMYDVTVDRIYTYNPETKGGLKRGSVITIPQEAAPINDGSTFFYYTIRPGDTLGVIADTYNTSIEDLMRDNKGLSEYKFEVGDILRVRVNSNQGRVMTETIEETKLDHLDTYRADKGDSWQSVSEKTGVGEEELREANAGTQIKKNATIVVPVTVTTEVERQVAYSDSRESSEQGRFDIYKDVHSLHGTDSISGLNDVVSVAVIIEDPKSKRDNEFTRGAFLAIDELKSSPYKINLKVLQSHRSEKDSVSATQKLIKDLDDFDADLIVATCESNFPMWLAKYGEDNGVEIVNAFDVRSELYMENPSIIHLLTPSSYFSEEVAEWADSRLSDYQLVMVGDKDSDDAFAEALIEKLGDKKPLYQPHIEYLTEMQLDENGAYLFYGYPTSRDEVSSMLAAVVQLKENNPLARIKVMGRPSWITLADGLKDAFANADVYFPSRFYFDHTGSTGKEFIEEYSAAFGHGPIRSFPTYAAAGYDIMNYFIPGLASNNGDFNVTMPEGKELQTPINLERMGNWGGFFNSSSYIIRYNYTGDVEKILIKK